jgi:hypothetical protein
MTNQITIEIEQSPGSWLNITSDVRLDDKVTIARGRSDFQSQAGPQRLSFKLNNRTGKYSPRNPMSTLYGLVGRNTPVRCTIDSGARSRFYGYIPDLGPTWNDNHSDNWIQVDAYGILRRLSQGQPPISNALRDWILPQSTLAAYYPLMGGEDTIYSQNLAPGKTGSFFGSSGAIFKYGVDLGAAWLDTGMELNATGDIPYMQGTAAAAAAFVAFDFVFQSPAFGVLDVQLWPSYDSYFNVRLNTSGDAGTIQSSYYDDFVGTITNSATGAIDALQDTELHTCRVLLRNQPGLAIQYVVYIDGVSVDSGTNGITQTLSVVPIFRFHYSRFVGQTVMNLAHLTVWADNTEANLPDVNDYHDAAFAHGGEFALTRLARVCSDADVPVSIQGTAADSQVMGPQFDESRLEQIRDVESTDMGILAERRDAQGLLYVSSSSMYNQISSFTLAYDQRQAASPLLPVDDDQVLRNDVTATRRGGGSDRYTVDTGPLSTLDPPDGVGRYETEITVNIQADDQLLAVAGWVANIGTLDKARWPSVTANLQATGVTSTLRNSVKDADIGDLFRITGLSRAFVYDDANLIIVGYTEVIDPFVHQITFNCMPAEPFETFVVESTGSRISPGETALVNASMTTTQTTMSVLSADGVTLWDTAGDDFSIMVAGEEMLCTAISGTTPGSAQTFTVTRSQNSVVKTHSSGEIVRLKRRAVIPL